MHHASGFSDYASIVADQSSLEALLVNAETMAQILTEGQKVRIVTQIKNKGSRTGNNEAMFVGGVTTTANEFEEEFLWSFSRSHNRIRLYLRMNLIKL